MTAGVGEEAQGRTTRSVQGERRVVTILFCDVAGSTAIAESLDPEEWAEIMDEAFDIFISPIKRYEGTVARLMGDAILAFFGAPVAHEDDPLRAVLSGMDILSGLKPLQEEMKLEYGHNFDVRIGINTGPVVVAEIGSDTIGEYTAMGDAVNLAARMEQTAEPGTIQISEDTYRRIAPLFHVEELGPVEVRGKSEAVNAYRILNRKSEPGRLRGIEGHRAALVGREEERAKLLDIVNQVQRGRGQIVSLIGEAGIGKSRLIEETHSMWDQAKLPESTWKESHGISFDMTLPYGLFRQILRQSCKAAFEDSNDVIRLKIKQLLDRVNVEEEDDRSKITRAVEILLQVGENAKSPQLTGEDLKRVLYEGVRSLLFNISKTNPVVLVCDDLHWADQASIDLLIYLFELSDQAPILFLTAFRPERQSPGWQIKNQAETDYSNRYTLINLKPLSNDESEALVSKILTIADLPAAFRESILAKAEGNPFFVEEVIRTLIDGGAVVYDESKGVWTSVKSLEEIDIPDNLQAIILSRIDRLEMEARSTLQLASVIGRSFYYRVLERISEKISELDKHLNTLEKMDLIQEEAIIPEREYLFRHELTRDAAYKSILRRQRRKFHRNVAEAIESMYADRIDEEAHRLAYHFYRARDYPRALEYYIIAGDKSAGLYANTEAVDQYTHALEIAETIPLENSKLIHVYTSLGRVYEVSGDFEAAMRIYKSLEEEGERQKNQQIILAALIPQATIYSIPSSQIDKEQGRIISERALELARELGDYRAESKVLWNLLLLEELVFGDKYLAIQYGEKAIAIAREHDLKEELAYPLHDITRAYFESGMFEEAWAAYEESNELWRELNNLPMLADNLGAVAQGLFYMGEFQLAMEKVKEGIEVSRKIGNQWGQAYNISTAGFIHIEFGNISQAIGYLTEAIPLAHGANFTAGEVIISAILAWLYGTFDDRQRALEWGRTFLNKLEKLGQFEEYEKLWRGLILYYSGEPEKASNLLDDAIEKCCMNVMDDYMGPLLAFLLCTLSFESGKYTTAVRLCNEAIENMIELNLRLFLPDIKMIKGNALIELGETEQGYNALYSAYEESKSTGSRRSALFVLASLVGAEQRRNNTSRAEELSHEGREVVEYISSHIDDPQLQVAFLSGKPVRTIMDGD